ncbi:hypothetical protein [Bacillus infantis]|uniref:hypothetical protein n=1 Tax=Bacillus infantis TaxID=324767 RepID=UPI00209F9716|nr:hypothetical protein [Bacillus infantis]MCP1159382.1 hypothetical protein [Bacillus infantis]
MEFVIQLLKEKKKEIEKEYEGTEDNIVKYHAAKLMNDQIDKAIWTLEYEHHYKHLSEKQIDEKMGIRKVR